MNGQEIIKIIDQHYPQYVPFWDRDVAPLINDLDLTNYIIDYYIGTRGYSVLRIYLDDKNGYHSVYMFALYPDFERWVIFTGKDPLIRAAQYCP